MNRDDDSLFGPAPNPLLEALHDGNVVEALKCLESDVAVNAVDPRPLLGGRQTALHLAAGAGFLEVVSRLIERGADLNAPALGGQTPLWLAANAGKRDVVRALLEAGADPNIECAEGYPPVGRAQASDSETIGLLESFGAVRRRVCNSDKDAP